MNTRARTAPGALVLGELLEVQFAVCLVLLLPLLLVLFVVIALLLTVPLVVLLPVLAVLVLLHQQADSFLFADVRPYHVQQLVFGHLLYVLVLALAQL